MKNSILFIVSVIALAILHSCSIEKRLYRPGFHVDVQTQQPKKFVTTSHDSPKQNTTEHKVNHNQYLSEKTELFTTSNSAPSIHETTTAFTAQPLLATAKDENRTILSTVSKTQLIQKILKENSTAWTLYKAKPARGGDNQIIAILLCFFLGFLGIHSFYLGNKKKGIIQLVMFLVGILTFIVVIGYLILSALGIWILIDFIRLIIGDLGPGW
ncbi:MAG: TM2 domain-containing protein [Bacteroidales bacterium]|nr:TM2 domain-containing protein [Bacteroidales bacterium]